MRQTLKLLTYLLLLGLTFLGTRGSAQFTRSFAVNPLLFELMVSPKETKEFSFMVVNGHPKKTEKFHIYKTDLEMALDGQLEFPEAGSTKWSAAEWVELSREIEVAGEAKWVELGEEIEVKPSQGKTIKGRITVPRRAKGSRFLCIMVEPIVEGEKRAQEETGVGRRLVMPPAPFRIGILVLLTVKTKRKSLTRAKISSLNVDTSEEGLVFTATLTNKGNIHIRAKGEIVVKDKTGRKWEKCKLEAGKKGTVFPDSARNFTATIRRIPAGDYTVRASITYAGRKRTFIEIPLTIAPEIAKVGKALAIDFDLEPDVLEVKTFPGAYRSETVKFSSNEAETIHIKVHAENIEGLDPRWSCVKWLKIQPTEFDIKPGKGKSVKLVLSDIPEGTEGGRYTRIVSSATIKGSKEYPSGKETILVMTVPKTLEMSGELTKLNIRKNEFIMEFRNTGNVHLEPKGTLTIKNKETLNIAGDKIPFGEELILPDESKEFAVPLPLLEEGTYIVEAAVSYNKKQITLTKEFIVKF